MNRIITALSIGGVLAFGMQAFADDPPDPAAPSSPGQSSHESSPTHMTTKQKQFMKECMAKAKASNNGMSPKDMKKGCMDQLKTNVDQTKEPVAPQY